MSGYPSRRPCWGNFSDKTAQGCCGMSHDHGLSEKPPRYSRGIGCVLWLTLPCDLGGLPVGNAKASLLFFSEFTIPVAQKASWLLSFGTGVLLVCVAWDISTSGCFYTVQDLLGRPVRTRCCLGSLALFLSRRFCILLYYDLLQAGLGEWSWRHYGV